MNRLENVRLMKYQTFGVEVEMAKLSKHDTAQVVQDYFKNTYGADHEIYRSYEAHDPWVATDHHGRKWKFMDDNSERGRLGSIDCEMVTPPLTYDDIEDLQEIIRILRGKGVKSNADYMCGVHIHVGMEDLLGNSQTAKSLRNLVNIITSHERLIAKAIDFSKDIRGGYTKFMNPLFVGKLNDERPRTVSETQDLYYSILGGRRESTYPPCRYYFLNLHAIARHNTVEFRMFEFHKNMHAGELKAYIQLCLAMTSYAKLVAYASPAHVNVTNEKFAMKNWLVNLGLTGDEFKTARKMLTKRLTGDTAYLNGRPVSDSLDDLSLAD